MTKKHYNAHRIGKKSFQAMLRPAENDLVMQIKNLRGITQNRELLMTLLDEEKKRLEVKGHDL